MRSRGFVFSSPPAEFFAAHRKPTNAAGRSAGCHAEADHPELHRQPRLRPGAHGPVRHTQPRLTERLPRRLGERDRSTETYQRPRGRRAPGGRAPQTGLGYLHSYVPAALSVGAAYCLLHQLPAPELVFRLHAI